MFLYNAFVNLIHGRQNPKELKSELIHNCHIICTREYYSKYIVGIANNKALSDWRLEKYVLYIIYTRTSHIILLLSYNLLVITDYL